MPVEYIAETPDALLAVAQQIVSYGRRIILLEGDLGAGKTTFVQALCRQLGSVEAVTSPTFSLINEYRDRAGMPIFHIDLYRLERIDDALQIGIEDYLASGAWCLIEWPELIASLIDTTVSLRVHITAEKDGSRKVRILM